MKFILHGGDDVQTDYVRKLLDRRSIPYSVELEPEENHNGQLVLINPGRALIGLREINSAWGDENYRDVLHSLEAQSKTAVQ